MSDVTIDLANPDTYAAGIPHDAFRYLRERDPVSWQPPANGAAGFWAVTRYHDIMSVLRTPATYSSWLGGALLPDPPKEFLERLREGMLNRDPPDHTVLRKLVSRAFSPRRLGVLEAKIAAHATALVDRIADAKRCDFAMEIAGEMPLFVICEMLGVPAADRKTLYGLTARMFGNDKLDAQAAFRDGIAAAEQMRAYGAALGRDKAASPSDDLASDLLAADANGRGLTDGEFQAFFMLLFNAGSDTTRSLLSYGLDLLLSRPDVMAQLRDDLSLLPRGIEEMLRFEPAVIQFRRTAVHDTELAGQRIAAGDKVVVFFPSANRDDAVFANPDTFDLERWPNDHLAFGYGTHYCLGASLARMESKHVFREVLERMDGLERAAPAVTSRTNFIRSVRHLEIEYRGVQPSRKDPS